MSALLQLALALPLAAAPQDGGVDPADIGFDQNVGQVLPADATFVDSDGRRVRLGELFTDRPCIVALVYYECPMLCTLVLNGLVAGVKPLSETPGEDYDVVVISIDPGESHELAAMKKERYLRLFEREETAAGWHFLSGEEDAIRSVSEVMGFRYVYDEARDEYAHASGIVVATPQRKLARYFYGVEYSSRDLRLALVEASAGKLGTFVDQALLLCLHYDPLTGKYGMTILTVIRGLGLATMVGLGAFVLWSVRRGRALRRGLQPALGVGGGR